MLAGISRVSEKHIAQLAIVASIELMVVGIRVVVQGAV
jgi:hypothetical protein